MQAEVFLRWKQCDGEGGQLRPHLRVQKDEEASVGLEVTRLAECLRGRLIPGNPGTRGGVSG